MDSKIDCLSDDGKGGKLFPFTDFFPNSIEDLLSVDRSFSFYGKDKIFVVDKTLFLFIENVEHNVRLSVSDINSLLLDHFLELIKIDQVVIVRVSMF